MSVGGPFQRFVQHGFRSVGLELRRYPRAAKDGYAPVHPYATYSPWLTDREFAPLQARITDNTLVDRYRLYELWQLVGQVAHVEGALLEVGVWRGGTGALIAKRAQLAGIKDPVFLCDTFSGVVKAGSADSDYKGGEHADTSETIVQRLLDDLQVKNAVLVKGVFPDDTGKQLADRRFRFAHIDVDVYQSAEDIVAWLWDRLCVGGMIVYDDYGFSGCDGVARHVDAQRALPDRIVVHNLNGHAVVVKTR